MNNSVKVEGVYYQGINEYMISHPTDEIFIHLANITSDELNEEAPIIDRGYERGIQRPFIGRRYPRM